MRSMQIKGFEELEEQLRLAGTAAQGIAKASLYEGAGLMANAIRKGLDGIKTEPFHYAKDGEKRLPSPQEKAAVLAARYGIAKHEGSGAEVSTVVGISSRGVTAVTMSKDYEHKGGYIHRMGAGEKDIPVAVLLRSIETGTSFMTGQPVVRKAINGAKSAAASRIVAEAESRLQKIFKD